MSEPRKYREFWIADTTRYGHVSDNWSPICGEDPKDSVGYEGNTLHVVEISALHEAEQKIDELEIQVHDLKNTSPVEALRALREVDKMKLDRANKMLEYLARSLEDTKQYVNENTEYTINQALKYYEEWKSNGKN